MCWTPRAFPYDDTPGVSSFCGAAAALNAEYTLPTVSQTVIITRMEGRTPVPEKKKSWQALPPTGQRWSFSYPSALWTKYSRRFWKAVPIRRIPRQRWCIRPHGRRKKTVRCTVGTLAESVHAAGITKTALIVAGGFLGRNYERSKLYDPAFTTEFRKGTDQ